MIRFISMFLCCTADGRRFDKERMREPFPVSLELFESDADDSSAFRAGSTAACATPHRGTVGAAWNRNIRDKAHPL
jgi:hypothetical protein